MNTRNAIFAFIKEYNEQCGKTPSVRQIAEAVNRAPSTVQRQLKVLVRGGKLFYEQHGKYGKYVLKHD